MHLLLAYKIDQETTELIEQLIEHHEEKLRKKNGDKYYSEMDKYFVKEVEIPYVTFLKKLNVWNTIRSLALETDPINIGFS